MIRDYQDEDFDEVLAVINDAATAYKGVIPADCWHDPYMSAVDLQGEISAGVSFKLFYEKGNTIVGVMGAQPVQDVLLVRHAYVRTQTRRHGVGSKLLLDLRVNTSSPILVGTWAAAGWAIRFYEKHDFKAQTFAQTQDLLKKYWSVPERQAAQSVVLICQS
ncbi:MAG: GNAT family N-acetyltransferase [Alphaproteobacteria bacterium]|jgi:N-acetylglutamate synthase-like GNAT family acetyltransferase